MPTLCNSRQKGKKESRGVVTSRGRTRAALLRLALCYSVVLCAQRINPYLTKDGKRMCQSNQIKWHNTESQSKFLHALARLHFQCHLQFGESDFLANSSPTRQKTGLFFQKYEIHYLLLFLFLLIRSGL